MLGTACLFLSGRSNTLSHSKLLWSSIFLPRWCRLVIVTTRSGPHWYVTIQYYFTILLSLILTLLFLNNKKSITSTNQTFRLCASNSISDATAHIERHRLSILINQLLSILLIKYINNKQDNSGIRTQDLQHLRASGRRSNQLQLGYFLVLLNKRALTPMSSSTRVLWNRDSSSWLNDVINQAAA